MKQISTPELYNLFVNASSICIDSRIAQSNELFFAISGDNFDGNQYAEKALGKCRYAIVDDASVVKDERFILVDNTLLALQQLATYHRQQLGIPIIAITGTNGKTTTKELVARVMARKYNVAYTKGNYNNHIGVPLTLLSFTKEHEFGVVEMGANHIGEIALLCEITQPDFGLITNVGKAHLEGFGSFSGVKKAKSELYKYLYDNNGTAFVNYDNEQLEDMDPPHSIVYYGTGGFTHCQGRIGTCDSLFLQLDWLISEKGKDSLPDWENKALTIKTQLVGDYNFENVMAAVCIGNNFNIAAKDIVEAVDSYKPDNNRSQIVETDHNTLILDGYNANPTSMKASILNFKQLQAKRKVLILGDMLELGKSSVAEHGIITGLIEEYVFDEVILVGEQFGKLVNSLFVFIPDVDALKLYLRDHEIKDATILIKGSRGIKLELIQDLL